MKNKLKWLPLFITNFAGVLNDNLLKTLIGFVCVLWIGPDSKATLVSAAAALLVLPYIFLSPWAGKLAREHPKATIIKAAKLAEIPIMTLAALGFITSNIYVVMGAMFLMGVQSCIYSPSKYGIIRDIGGIKGISFGTGAMEMLTFVAVLTGTFLGGYLSDLHQYFNRTVVLVTLCTSFILLALAGWLSSLGIQVHETAPEDDSNDTLNPFIFPIKWFRWSKQLKGLNTTVLGLSLFWFIGSMVQMNLYIYCEEYLHLSNTSTGTIMALVAIGIGAGCYAAGLISNHKVNTRLVPAGGAGMVVSMLVIFVLKPDTFLFTVLIIIFAFFAGLFKIPLNAYMQDRVKGRELGPVIAYNNQMVFVAILLSAGVFSLVENIFNARIVFLTVLLITLVITIIVYVRLPGARWKR
ncbi:Predicted arabinose efflux permease, MFS family [Saccharicrinis carchari]|uniref:Predicted arabinose efflux permease, MFS family n=1 Tax=Saccharicrinis carchari TaxID=1168039 RepID=A0A521ETD2_SACCC|nr:MFS transporter [Saccharicrinis carchari]SMO87167.1 Predicted arabinose efflux permease, MFS family [Saccharicrinis carchari]